MPQHSLDYKLTAIKYYNKVKSLRKTCEIFECNHSTLSRWVKKYKNNDLQKSQSNRKSYKVRKIHVKHALQLIKNNKLITLNELNNKLKTKFDDYNITLQWLGQVLKYNNITRKRTRVKHFPEKRFGKKIYKKEEVEKLFKKIKKYKMSDVISIDETSIKPGMMKEYCREEKGKRCYVRTTDNVVFQKFTVIFAISSSKTISYELYNKGGINSERFLKFIKNNILDKYKNKLLLFDNAGAHHSKKVLDEIKKSGNDYVFNVPYHPESIPVENFFNQVKHYMKLDKPMSFIALKTSLKNAIKKVKKQNYKNYFTYAFDKKKLMPRKRKVSIKNKPKYKD